MTEPTFSGISDGELNRLAREVSNWDRWGSADTFGTLNLSADVDRSALLATLSGQSISLARPLTTRNGPDYELHPAPLHFMIRSGESAPAEGFASSADWFGVGCHGFGVTHIDALSHVFWDGKMYNGVPAATASTTAGSRIGSVEDFAGGVVTRGVLLDVARMRGVPWLEPGEVITTEDLDRCETEQKVEVARGDTVFIRTGIRRRQTEQGPHSPLHDGHPGLHPTCMSWIHERDICVLGSDGISDVMGPGLRGMPVHVLSLVYMGMPLVDNADLEQLGATCEEKHDWTFLSVISALRIRRGTGSPINPLAVF